MSCHLKPSEKSTCPPLGAIAIPLLFRPPIRPVSGMVLDGWIRDKNPSALVLAELFPDESADQLKVQLPEFLLTLVWNPVLELASAARKRRLSEQRWC